MTGASPKGVRPGLPEKEENRAELGAEGGRMAPEAPRGPAGSTPRLEDLEVEAIKALTEFFAAFEALNLHEAAAKARGAKEAWFALGKAKLEEIRGRKREEAKKIEAPKETLRVEEEWRVIYAPKPISTNDKAVQWLVKKIKKYNLNWNWVTNNAGEVVGVRYQSAAPMLDLESAARWALKAAADRPSAGPSDGEKPEKK